MFRQLISVLLCVGMLLYAYGCSSTKAVSMNEYLKDPRTGIEKIVLLDGSIIEFDTASGRLGVLQNEEIVGFTKTDGEVKHIPISKVQSIYYVETNTGGSVLLGGGILVGVAIVCGVLIAVYLVSTLEKLK